MNYKFINILIVFGVVLFSCSNKEGIPNIKMSSNAQGFSLINGVRYDMDQPFSGYIFELYADGNLKTETQYLEGRKHGYEKYWFSNDSIATERYYKHGIKTGIHKSWWDNGQPKFVYHFNDKGEYHGAITEWYPDGQLAKVFNFSNGEEIGSQKLFKSNGSIKANYEVVNGERYGLIGLKKCYTVTQNKTGI